jgi:hypothetical protein
MYPAHSTDWPIPVSHSTVCINRINTFIVDEIYEVNISIICRGPPGDATSISAPVMVIGANNVFEVDCCSEALKIGDNNILEAKC